MLRWHLLTWDFRWQHMQIAYALFLLHQTCFACKFNWICAEYNDGMPIDNNDYLFVESSDLGDEIHINFFFHILFNTYSIALIWFDCGNLTTTT